MSRKFDKQIEQSTTQSIIVIIIVVFGPRKCNLCENNLASISRRADTVLKTLPLLQGSSDKVILTVKT